MLKHILPCLVLLGAATTAHAELYKWVDANGKTYYSDRNTATGPARVDQLPVPAAPTQTIPRSSAWEQQEADFKQRRAQHSAGERSPSRPTETPAWARRGAHPETDASRCALARAILRGSAVRSSGVATDANDRTIAQNDISAFCR